MNDDLIREAEQIANSFTDMKKFIDDILRPCEKPKPTPTHCLDFLRWLTCFNYELIKANYIVDGLEAEVLDKVDWVKYKLVIKPI